MAIRKTSLLSSRDATDAARLAISYYAWMDTDSEGLSRYSIDDYFCWEEEHMIDESGNLPFSLENDSVNWDLLHDELDAAMQCKTRLGKILHFCKTLYKISVSRYKDKLDMLDVAQVEEARWNLLDSDRREQIAQEEGYSYDYM